MAGAVVPIQYTSLRRILMDDLSPAPAKNTSPVYVVAGVGLTAAARLRKDPDDWRMTTADCRLGLKSEQIGVNFIHYIQQMSEDDPDGLLLSIGKK